MLKRIIKLILPPFAIRGYHFMLALLGAVFYFSPSRKIIVIGITGTNGKSTVVELATKILEEAGYKVASLSSISFRIGEKEEPNLLKMTMPGRFQIQRFLRQAVNSGCKYAVLEVTSEGIKQYRHKFIDFNSAVFTNLSPEHIEAHGSFEKYREAKGKLFQAAKKIHIINLDDENADYFLQFPASKKYGYTIKNKEPAIENRQKFFIILCPLFNSGPDGVNFEAQGTKFNLKLIGEFNISNALAAICVGLTQNISLETCQKALEKIEGIPGRMELVISDPFKVFVDYAFTPAALEKVYQGLTNNYKLKTNKLICVLGAAGGGRDKWKRSVLGEIAGKYCTEIIVTNEDPYDENPLKIIEDVSSGAGGKAQKILDRREAINYALKNAKPGDSVIITGKGCEPWICVAGGKKIPWDDRRVVKEEFAKLNL